MSFHLPHLKTKRQTISSARAPVQAQTQPRQEDCGLEPQRFWTAHRSVFLHSFKKEHCCVGSSAALRNTATSAQAPPPNQTLCCPDGCVFGGLKATSREGAALSADVLDSTPRTASTNPNPTHFLPLPANPHEATRSRLTTNDLRH